MDTLTFLRLYEHAVLLCDFLETVDVTPSVLLRPFQKGQKVNHTPFCMPLFRPLM